MGCAGQGKGQHPASAGLSGGSAPKFLQLEVPPTLWAKTVCPGNRPFPLQSYSFRSVFILRKGEIWFVS